MFKYPGISYGRKTLTYPWERPIPYTPDFGQFIPRSLGVLCNSGGVAAPTAATYCYLVSTGKYDVRAGQAVNAVLPITNPTDMGVGNYWYEPLAEADIVLIRPYLVKFSSTSFAAYAAAATAAGISANLTFFLIKQGRPPQAGLPMEYTAEIKGKVTVTNAATAVSASKWLPSNLAGTTGAQWCDAKTVITDYTISPGILADGEVATGALRLRFDQEGAVGLLTVVSDLTSACGAGWLTSHL